MPPVIESPAPRHRLYALAIAGAAIPLNGGLVAALPLAYAAFRDRLAWTRTPIDLPLGAFMLWFGLAAALSGAGQALALVVITVFGAYVAFQLPYRWLQAQPNLSGVLHRWACVGLPVAAAFGLYSYFFVSNVHLEGFHRFTLGGELPALYAFGLEVALLLSLGAPMRRRWLVLGSIAVGTFALIETFSRWAVLGFGMGMLVWSILMARRNPRAVATVLATIVLASTITIALPVTRTILSQYLPGPSDGNRLVRALVVGFTPQIGFPERLVIWRTTLRILRDHPWIGVGPGGFFEAYHKHLDPEARAIKVLETPVQAGGVYHAHNDVLTIAATSGIPAAMGYVALMLVATIRMFSNPHPQAAPAAAAFIAMLVHGLFDAIPTTFAGPSIVFWLVLAVALQRSEPEASGA